MAITAYDCCTKTQPDPTSSQEAASSFTGLGISTVPDTEPLATSSSRKKTINKLFKCLTDFVITVCIVTFIFLISVVVLIPVGAVAGLRLTYEFAYNRYRHYEKHHRGELAQERRSLNKALRDSHRRMAYFLGTHCARLKDLKSKLTLARVTGLNNRQSVATIHMDQSINKSFYTYICHANEAERITNNLTNASLPLNYLKRFVAHYKEDADAMITTLSNLLNNSYQELCKISRIRAISINQLILQANKDLVLCSQILKRLDSPFHRRNCMGCCLSCNWPLAEIFPSSVRAGLITLVSLPYLIPVGAVMGAFNTIRMATADTSISNHASGSDAVESDNKPTTSQFPWRSPYPFSNERKIIHCYPFQ